VSEEYIVCERERKRKTAMLSMFNRERNTLCVCERKREILHLCERGIQCVCVRETRR